MENRTLKAAVIQSFCLTYDYKDALGFIIISEPKLQSFHVKTFGEQEPLICC